MKSAINLLNYATFDTYFVVFKIDTDNIRVIKIVT